MSSITILYLVLAAVFAFAIAYFQYFYKRQGTKGNNWLAILRFLGVFIILLVLINPQIKSQQLEDVKPNLNILVDNSSSISYAKQEQKVKQILQKIKQNPVLQDKFNVNYFALAGDLSQQDTFSFKQPKTDILKTLKSLQSLTKASVAPTILITDGNQTYGSNYEFYKSNQAIYPIIVGDTIAHDDIRINQVNVNSYTSLDHKFPVEVFLQYDGKESIRKQFSVQLNGKTIFKENVAFSAEKSSRKLAFYLPATRIGQHHYKCSIGTLKNEKNTINNIHNFSVEVIDEQSKILLFTAVNHPDVSMLKRSIESNEQRKVIVTNKLNKPIQFKDYQLVILYQPTREFKTIFEKLKNNTTNFFIITGTQTEWNFLNNAQAYFNKKSIQKTEKYTAKFNLDFDEFITEDIDFSNLPPLEDYFGDVSFSVAHKTILQQTISGYTTENPLLATFTEGNRRGAILFGEHSWKWRMLSKVENQSFEKFDTFFAKLIQYLSSNKRSNQLEVHYKPFVYSNSEIRISTQFFDANFVFDPTANLSLILTQKETKQTKEYPFTLKKNTYELILKNLNPANYAFKVAVKNHQIRKRGTFTVLPYEIEQQLSTSNTKGLKSLAALSGGNFYHQNETNSLYKQLISDKRYATIQKSTEKIVSLVEFKWLLGILILVFSLEWFIRKYRGLI